MNLNRPLPDLLQEDITGAFEQYLDEELYRVAYKEVETEKYSVYAINVTTGDVIYEGATFWIFVSDLDGNMFTVQQSIQEVIMDSIEDEHSDILETARIMQEDFESVGIKIKKNNIE